MFGFSVGVPERHKLLISICISLYEKQAKFKNKASVK